MNTYKCLKSSCPNSGVRIIAILLQNSQWHCNISTQMTQLTNQLQAFHPYPMVDIIDFLKNTIDRILYTHCTNLKIDDCVLRFTFSARSSTF